ncbi:MAG TPA: iron-containing alcohol dehydrogenase [Burkholderiaceae bacterium]|nr:iron-containing alcohol dehydrogenase [Burkholderiaceae bacterium]HQR71764.1 iron-containing alcohol dehydrogenase [Burkholderiaceae bacterium]
MSLIYYITQVQFDFGAIKLTRAECERVGIRRPLVCTDRGVVAAGLLDRLRDALGDLPAAVFDATPSNPTESAVMAAVGAFREHGADGLIALGGGSAIDLAKGVAIMAAHPGTLADYATILGGSPKITDRVAPLIAIPTTAGTGSEVARGAIIVLDDGRKLGFHSWHLVPKTAICDPELTYGLPARLTAATGMDAVAHCVETFLSKAVNPPADAIAFDGLARGLRFIEKATREPRDPAARWNMMSASMQGAMAFQKGLGAVHSLSHALGGLKLGAEKIGPHHGTLNAVLLPEVVKFNEKTVPERVQAIATVFGVTGGDELAHAIRSLNRRLELPSGLGDMGVTPDLYDDIADAALKDHCHATNPRVATHADYVAMLAASA